MSAQEQIMIPGRTLASRLEGIVDSLPKEGYKAAVAVGVVERSLELLNEVRDLASKVACVARSKGGCKGEFCDAKCGGLFLERVEDEIVLAKHGSNPFSARLAPGRLEVKVRDARLVLEGSEAKAGISGVNGIVWTTIDLSDVDSIFENNYTLKYVLRRVGIPLIRARTAIQYCMAMSAITC